MTERTPSQRLLWLVIGFHPLIAGLQLAIFATAVSGGRSFDFLAYRVDGLNLAFGVGWILALGLGLPTVAANAKLTWKQALYLCSFSVGLLNMAYAREPLLFVFGWEVVGLSLWLSLREMGLATRVQRMALAIHLPGLLFLLALPFSVLRQFTPPGGGETTSWPLYMALLFGAVALFRACYWLFAVPVSHRKSVLLVGLYILAAPFVLAKALVAAPWDSVGEWALVLIGTAALLGVLLAMLQRADYIVVAPAACACIAIAGFGLSGVSPLAAVGAVGLLLAIALWLAMPDGVYRGVLFFAGALPSVWLLSQGALDARYRLVAALLIPALALAAWYLTRQKEPAQTAGSIWALPSLAAAILAIFALYPQATIEWVLRPAIGSMAGGVGVPATLLTNWGVGLMVKSPQEIVLAALPATGIALAIFLAWVVLRILRWLALWTKHDS